MASSLCCHGAQMQLSVEAPSRLACSLGALPAAPLQLALRLCDLAAPRLRVAQLRGQAHPVIVRSHVALVILVVLIDAAQVHRYLGPQFRLARVHAVASHRLVLAGVHHNLGAVDREAGELDEAEAGGEGARLYQQVPQRPAVPGAEAVRHPVLGRGVVRQLP